MTLPSFTVDASLYPMSERYRLVTCVTDSLGVVFVLVTKFSPYYDR
jgi:hypothetical protein